MEQTVERHGLELGQWWLTLKTSATKDYNTKGCCIICVGDLQQTS
jgi:hypothetical protein